MPGRVRRGLADDDVAIRLIRRNAMNRRTVCRREPSTLPVVRAAVVAGLINVGDGHKPFTSGCSVMPVDRPAPIRRDRPFWY